MKSIAAMVIASAITLAGAPRMLVAQTAPGSIQGVWQTTEIRIAGATPRVIPVADPRAFVTIFTARHYSRTEIQAEGPRTAIPDVSKATADELRALWGPVVAEAGTYEVSGETLTLHPQSSKSPAAMASGAFIFCTFKIDGNTLTIAQVRNQTGPYPSPVTFKLIRVE